MEIIYISFAIVIIAIVVIAILLTANQKKKAERPEIRPAARNTGSASKPEEVKIQKKTAPVLRFKTAQGSGTCDPDTGELYWEGKPDEPIPLKAGVAALAEAFPRGDSVKIIRLLAEKKGSENLKQQFAEKVGFDKKDYVEMGIVQNESPEKEWNPAEKRVCQSRNNTKEYCLVQYISGIPVQKEDYCAEGFEIELRRLLGYTAANKETIKKILERDFPVKTLQLSELRAPGSENDPLPELSEEHAERLKMIALDFFGDQETVLQKPSSDLQADKQLAVKRLIQFLDALDIEEFPFVSGSCFRRIIAYKNKLEIVLAHWESRCYDGGCGGTYDEIKLYLERMNEDTSWLHDRFGLSEEVLEKAKQFVSYHGTLQRADGECMISVWRKSDGNLAFSSFILCNPFGLQGNYRIRIC